LFWSADLQMKAGTMRDERQRRVRYGEAFWRAHHEAWQRSDLNQREYCAAQGIPLKAFGNWRARFMAEPQPVAPKLLYRRGGLSPILSPIFSPSLSPTPSHGAYPTMTAPSPLIVPPSRDGHRRRFGEADRRRIVAQAEQPGISLSELARRYDIDLRVLRRWKRELTQQAVRFVTVAIVEAQHEEALS
jgi:hypothetical protein